jgi:dihydrofolate reductase
VAKMLYGATMSLDGFIAGPGGDMSWLTEYLGTDEVGDRLVDRIGSLLVGRTTFDGDDPNRGTDKEGAFGGAWSGPQVVLTHNPPVEPVPDVTFVTDLDEAVRLAKDAAGDKDVCIIGADVARQCLEAGEVDEVLAFVAPILLGDGVRFFERPGGHTVRLEPMLRSEAPLATNLWFRVLR